MAGESAGSVPGPENCAANSSYDVSSPSPLQQSPATSPPPWELQHSPPPGAGRAVQEEGSPAPLFSDADLQRMVAMEQRAPLLFGSPPQQPGPHTQSSSIPHDAIQAEVASWNETGAGESDEEGCVVIAGLVQGCQRLPRQCLSYRRLRRAPILRLDSLQLRLHRLQQTVFCRGS